MKVKLLIAIFGCSSFLFSQTVCLGTTQRCIEAQNKLCAGEKAKANFQVRADGIVGGVLTDQSGAYFEGNVAVQLRIPGTTKVIQTSEVSNGRFNLGRVQHGLYRFIVVEHGEHEYKRLGMVDQPESVHCETAGTECVLSVVLKFHATDNPIDFCPPK